MLTFGPLSSKMEGARLKRGLSWTRLHKVWPETDILTLWNDGSCHTLQSDLTLANWPPESWALGFSHLWACLASVCPSSVARAHCTGDGRSEGKEKQRELGGGEREERKREGKRTCGSNRQRERRKRKKVIEGFN